MGYSKAIHGIEKETLIGQLTTADTENHFDRRPTMVDRYNKLFSELKSTGDKRALAQLLHLRKQIEYNRVTHRIKALLMISSDDKVDAEIQKMIRRCHKIRYNAPEVFLNDLIKAAIKEALPKHTGDQVLTLRKRKGKRHEFIATLINDYLPGRMSANIRYDLDAAGESLTVFLDSLAQQQIPVKVLAL